MTRNTYFLIATVSMILGVFVGIFLGMWVKSL